MRKWVGIEDAFKDVNTTIRRLQELVLNLLMKDTECNVLLCSKVDRISNRITTLFGNN